jgi:uncharacterized protein (TIGR00255 family)
MVQNVSGPDHVVDPQQAFLSSLLARGDAWYHPLVRSMTGYGRGVATHGETRATVDARSVNHRFLDLKLRGGIAPAIEEAISTKVRAAIDRGAVTIAIHLERAGAGGTRIDADAAAAAHGTLAAVATRLGVAGPDLALVLAQPGVIVSGDDRDDEDVQAAVIAALDAALTQLESMRRTEGAALAADLTARLGELDRLRVLLATLAAGLPQQVSKRLAERIKRLLDDATVDPARLAQEVAMLADRADITEELVRLASHLDQARAMIAKGGPAGRRLDFLVQEIGRELNTIGSKSALADLTAAVVEAKAMLEKVREQVQNVE